MSILYLLFSLYFFLVLNKIISILYYYNSKCTKFISLQKTYKEECAPQALLIGERHQNLKTSDIIIRQLYAS